MSLIDSADTDTLPKLLERNARRWTDLPAIREKDRGIWRTYSWKSYRDRVRDLALGLAALGFKRGDKLTVGGDNRPRLYWAQIAAQSLGGYSVPVYQDSIASELVYVLNHAETSVVIAEDQEQVDKILSLRDQLPNLRWIVYDDGRGMASYRDEKMVRSYEDVEAEGRAHGKTHPDFLAAEVAKGSASDLAMIAYTSGTTGTPKGVMLSHGNMIATAERFAGDEDVKLGDDWLAYLPMAWVGDTEFTVGVGFVAGIVANCPESPETVERDLREIGPVGLVAPPRIWENMLTSVQVKAIDAPWLKRVVYEYFRRIAERREIDKDAGKAASPLTSVLLALGRFFIYGPVRDQLGLRRARACYTGGAPLGPDAYRLFRSFGINLKQVYGATEASALIAVQPDAEARPDTVGRPLTDVSIRIAENGEVLVRGPNVFQGYFKQEEATRAALTEDGWLRTGDAGYQEPGGHVVIIDRARDVGKLADGTPFAPQFVENKLKFSQYIREAVAFGDQRPFVAAMIAIDMTTVGNWAEKHNLAYTSYMDLARRPEVAALVLDELAHSNASLPEAARVRRFMLLQKELEADDAEMTRTRKVRRRFVAEKYAAVIEAFYAGAPKVDLSMEITFEDGRKSNVDTTIAVHDVPASAGASRAA